MANGVGVAEKTPHGDIFRLVPATDEKRIMKKIEENGTRHDRDKLEINISEYGSAKFGVLLQINAFIDASKKSESQLHKTGRKFGLDIAPAKYIEVDKTLHYLAESSEFFGAEQLKDVARIATKLAEQKKDPKDAVRLLYKLSKSETSQDSQRLVSLSLKLLDLDKNIETFLLPISRMAPKARDDCLADILSLSEEMVGKGMNPKQAVSCFAELPPHLLESSQEILALSLKLAGRGINPTNTMLVIRAIPESLSASIKGTLSSAMAIADNPKLEEADPAQAIRSAYPRVQGIEVQRGFDGVMKRADELLEKGETSVEDRCDMEKSMRLLFAYSPEAFRKVVQDAVELLEKGINPNDLFLLAKSLAQYYPEKLEEDVTKLTNLMLAMRNTKFDDILTYEYSRSASFKRSMFENSVLFQLDRTLQKNPELFDEKLDAVMENILNGVNPDGGNPEAAFRKKLS